MSNQDIPSGEVQDNDYKSRTGQSQVPVVSDDQDVMNSVDREQADSDAQLGTPAPSRNASSPYHR